MKTQAKQKRVPVSLQQWLIRVAPVLAMLLSFSVHSQQPEGLRIEMERGGTQHITYPPETEFYLFDTEGKVVLANGDLEEDYAVAGQRNLIVKPPYKEGYDRLTLRQGDILGIPGATSDPEKARPKKDYGAYTGPVTLRKEFLGTSPEGDRNALLIFSNGLVFRYFDGKARAWYHGDEIAVEGKYIVDLGQETVKFSYDPADGKVWYVVVPNG